MNASRIARVVGSAVVTAAVLVGIGFGVRALTNRRWREHDRREIEPHLAVFSRSSVDEIAIAWMAVDDDGDAAEHVGTRVSFDGGTTFRETGHVTSPGDRVAADPSLTFAPDGTSYLTWLGFRDDAKSGGDPFDMRVYSSRRAPAATTWGTPREVSVGDPATVYDRPRGLAAADGRLLVAVRYSLKGRGGIALLTARDDGAPARKDLFESIGFLGGIPTICASVASAHVFVAWFDPIAGIELASTAETTAASPPTRVSTKGERVAMEAPYCFVDDESDGNVVTVVYGIGATSLDSASSAQLSSLVIARSIDGGKSFEQRREWRDTTGVMVHPAALFDPSGDLEFLYYAGPLGGSGALRHARLPKDAATLGNAETVRAPLVLAPRRNDSAWIGDYIGFARSPSGDHAYAAFGENLGHPPRVAFLRIHLAKYVLWRPHSLAAMQTNGTSMLLPFGPVKSASSEPLNAIVTVSPDAFRTCVTVPDGQPSTPAGPWQIL